MSSTVHTVPINDLRDHDTRDDCWCGPDIEYLDSGGKSVVHHSLDGREHSEPDHDTNECPLCSSAGGG